MIIVKKKKYEHGGYHEPPDGFTLEDYIRQMYAESRFDPKAGSPAGAAGLAQIMPDTRKYMIQRYDLPETVDVYNPKDARTMQRKYMEDLYTRSWNQGTEENKKLKALAAYNYGPTNTIRALKRAKKAGYDIDNDTSWTKDKKVLPQETRDYLNRTYFGTDEKFESEYSRAHDKYFDIFPEEKPQPQADLEEIPVIPPKIDPQLEQAFKIMGFKGYKDGGVTVKKYEHGGSHPTKEEKRNQLLATGRFTEGPNGELIRLPQPSQRERGYLTSPATTSETGMFGFPTTERARELSQSDQPLSEQELREYISYGVNPYNPVNSAFSMIAGASPAGAAVDAVGNIIGKGIGLGVRGGKALMRFLRPQADEATDAALASFGSIRPDAGDMRNVSPSQLQGGLEESNRLLQERVGEFFGEEGQRRAKQQIVDHAKYLDELARGNDAYLSRIGFSSTDISVLRQYVQRFRTPSGAFDPASPQIATELQKFNAKMRGLGNKSGEVVQRAGMSIKSDEALTNLKRLRDEAYEAGDYQRVADLEDQILRTNEAAMARNKLIADELTNASYSPTETSVTLGRENLVNPNYATTATAHEVQHAFQDMPFSRMSNNPPAVARNLGRTVEADRILDDLLLIDKSNPNILTDNKDYLWDDLAYFDTKQGHRLSEKTPFLSEMREDMLSKGYIGGRYDNVTDDIMNRYLGDYYGSRNTLSPSTNPGNQNVRILEIMDPNTGAYNAGVLKDAMNKMLVAVPAVGATGLAVGAGGDEESSYYKGGKLRLQKTKRYGMSVRKK